MFSNRSPDVLALLAGTRTDEEVALAHGVSVEEVRQWRRLYADGLEAGLARRDRSRRWARASLTTFGLVAAVGVAVASGEALSQATCSPTGVFTRLGLKFMCANEPALASDVNANAERMVALMEQKLGTVGDGTAIRNAGSVTTPAVDAGVILAGSLRANTVAAAALLPPYGAWSAQGLGAGGAGVVNDNGIYKALMVVGNDSGGGGKRRVGVWDDLHVNGQISGGALRHGSCNWVEVGKSYAFDNQYHQVTCPSGSFQAGFRCYVTDYLDGDCAAYCCTP